MKVEINKERDKLNKMGFEYEHENPLNGSIDKSGLVLDLVRRAYARFIEDKIAVQGQCEHCSWGTSRQKVSLIPKQCPVCGKPIIVEPITNKSQSE